MSIGFTATQVPRVSIIIPVLSRSELLSGCLRSLARVRDSEPSFEIIVVLNEASPDAVKRVNAMAADLRLIASPANLGMAGASNRGRELARGEYLLLLHDDVEVEAGWLTKLVETADAHPEAGAVGSMVLFPDGRLQNVGSILWRNALTTPPWIGKAPGPAAFDRLQAADYCGTCSLLVRAAAWDVIGGPDERFYPAYYVDVDLCVALRQHGFIVLFQPDSRIRHYQGSSSDLRFRRYLGERNHREFLEKWRDVLDEYEPYEQGSGAIERALARAEAFAQSRARQGTAMRSPPERRPIDPALHDQRHVEMSRALQQDYIAYLAQRLDEAEAERARWQDEREQRPAPASHQRIAGYLPGALLQSMSAARRIIFRSLAAIGRNRGASG